MLETVITTALWQKGRQDSAVRINRAARLVFPVALLLVISVLVRGIIANKKDQAVGDYDLIPGQYAPVRLILGEDPAALLIPQPALVESQIGRQVFVVNADNKVESRSVEIGRGYQGQWVIKKGLKKGEKVIVEGTQKVRPGVVVNAKPYAREKEPKQEKNYGGHHE